MAYNEKREYQPPPAYAPVPNNQQPVYHVPQQPQPVYHQTVVQPTTIIQQQQPAQVYQAPVIAAPGQPVHRFYGCCEAKTGWSILYGIILFCQIISIIVKAEKLFENSINPGPLIETIILAACLISLFIGMFKKKAPFFWPIIAYNAVTTVLLGLQTIACLLYVFGAQNFSIAMLTGLSYLNRVPFMPEEWDTSDDIDDIDDLGDHVVGAASWVGMLFSGIGFAVVMVIYAILTKGLNDYRKFVQRHCE